MINSIADKFSDSYRVDLAMFQGPLDLLLYLIRKDELDVYDIPISRITRQYAEYIDLMENLNLELAGEFVLMAATLIRIKAKLLLPTETIEGEEPDPREELILALIEYRKYKEAGEILREKALIEERNIVPPPPAGIPATRVELQSGTGLFDLLSAYKDLLGAKRDDGEYQITGEEINLGDRIKFVLGCMQNRSVVTFSELFSDAPRKLVAVVTFLAVLELCRSRRISVQQSLPFAELRVYRGDRFNAPAEAIDLIDEPKEIEVTE